MKRHDNPSSGSPGVPCEPTDRQADMTKQTVIFRKFANSPKNCSSSNYHSGVTDDAGNMDRDAASTQTFRKNLSKFHSRPQRT